MDSVVKIDKELERKVEELIRRNKFLYSSKKQVVNLAVIEFLNSVSWKEKQNQSIKSKYNLNKKKKQEKRKK